MAIDYLISHFDTPILAVTPDFHQCGILTSVDSDEPVQLKLQMMLDQ